MEVALGSAALVGVGLVWNRINKSQQAEHTSKPVQRSTRVVTEPSASNTRSASDYTRATAKSSVTPVPPGELSGRRDHSTFIDAPSPYEQQMSRVYGPEMGSKREVKQELNPSTMQDNVHVRSHSSYQTKFFDELQKPIKMHNVNTVATTTGTSSQLVGPGVGIGTDVAGNHGLHYGMVRMRPAIVNPTFREQKGSIIPGKSPIDTRTADMNLMRHASTGFSIGTSGFEKSKSSDQEPLKFHAISEDYLTSAPGRATVTGTPGAGGARLEPVKDNTNRGTNTSYMGVGSVAGLEAPDTRDGYTSNPNLSSDRGTQNEFFGIARGEGVARSGHQRAMDNFHIPQGARGTTEIARGAQVVNLSNPGAPAGTFRNDQEMQTTQRQTMAALDVINMNPQFPANSGNVGDSTRTTSRLPNEYRPGAAGIAAVPGLGGQCNQFESYSHGKLSMKTQRESLENKDYTGPLKTVGVNAPMSYSDVLLSEGYSNRDLPQSGFVPPAAPPGGTSVETAGIGHFDARPTAPNASRPGGGGVGNQSSSNFHLVNKNLESNPNKIGSHNTRLDPNILDALARNELSNAKF